MSARDVAAGRVRVHIERESGCVFFSLRDDGGRAFTLRCRPARAAAIGTLLADAGNAENAEPVYEVDVLGSLEVS